MLSFEFAFYVSFWDDILQRFNATSRSLQDPTFDINSAVAQLQGLKAVIVAKLDKFDDYVKQAEEKCGHRNLRVMTTRIRRPSVRHIEFEPQVVEDTHPDQNAAEELFRESAFNSVLSSPVSELDKRISAYDRVVSLFGFPRRLDTLTNEELSSRATTQLLFMIVIWSYLSMTSSCSLEKSPNYSHRITDQKKTRI